MNKSFDDVLILKYDWTVGQIVKDFVVSDVIVLDNSYEIPAMCAHMDDELISTLLKQNYLTLYGVFDNRGRIHINIDDFNRLKKYLGDEDTTNDWSSYRYRFCENIDWRCIDKRTPEDIRKDFWTKVVNHK